MTVERNRIDGAIHISPFPSADFPREQPHRARILRNYAAAVLTSNPPVAGGLLALNLLISNNIFYGNTGSLIENATFRHNYGVFTHSPTFRNCTVENNIIGGAGTGSRNSLIRHNFFAGAEPDAGMHPLFFSENSLSSNTWDLMFGTAVNEYDALLSGTGAFDERFQLSEDSQAIGAGFDGVDLGPYAGPFPYEISGVPPLPRVKIMAPKPFVVSPNSDLNIPVKITLE